MKRYSEIEKQLQDHTPDLHNNDPIIGAAPSEVFNERALEAFKFNRKSKPTPVNPNLIQLKDGVYIMANIVKSQTDASGETETTETTGPINMWDRNNELSLPTILFTAEQFIELAFGSNEELGIAYRKAITDKGFEVDNCLVSTTNVLINLGNSELIFDTSKTYIGYLPYPNEDETSELVEILEIGGNKISYSFTFSKPEAYVTLVALDGYILKMPAMNGNILMYTIMSFSMTFPEKMEETQQHFTTGGLFSLEPGGEEVDYGSYIINGNVTFYEIEGE